MVVRLLNFLGILVMIIVILAAAPLILPRVLGYQPYEVLTGSMEPAYPVGSVVYVKAADPDEIVEGDVITFFVNPETGLVNSHRVIEINRQDQTFTTKGDANQMPDSHPVSFDRLVGRVTFCVPHLGKLAEFVQSRNGQYTAVILFAVTLSLWLTADLLKRYKRRPD